MDSILPQTIGFEGPDGTNKTRFSLTVCNLLRLCEQKVLYCPYPNPHTAAGLLLGNNQRFEPRIASEALPALQAASRAETLPLLNYWIAKGSQHWIVFDRTKYSGEAYARASGEKDLEWLRALDRYFPDPELGFYLVRPLEESLKIAGRRDETSIVKDELDKNIQLQARIREIYPQILQGKKNWTSLNVSGIADNLEEFQRWEIKVGMEIWGTISTYFGNENWLMDGESLVKESLLGPFNQTNIMREMELIRSANLWREYMNTRTNVER